MASIVLVEIRSIESFHWLVTWKELNLNFKSSSHPFPYNLLDVLRCYHRRSIFFYYSFLAAFFFFLNIMTLVIVYIRNTFRIAAFIISTIANNVTMQSSESLREFKSVLLFIFPLSELIKSLTLELTILSLWRSVSMSLLLLHLRNFRDGMLVNVV